MRIWGISDLHLSFAASKPMEIFGCNWRNHVERISESWNATVHSEDVVLCPGDLSWATRLEDAIKDLNWIDSKPGLKIFSRGNHDYWWSSIGKVRAALPSSCVALQNDCYDLKNYVIAGSRCWSAPGGPDYTDKDKKIYEREGIRLEFSLKKAQSIAHGRPIIAAIHYPPFTASKEPTVFSELLEFFGVKICVYGHLHGERSHKTALQGVVRGVEYHLISSDYLNFKPLLLI